MPNFREQFTEEHRKKQAEKIMNKYPDRLPFVIEVGHKTEKLSKLDNSKFLVPRNITFGKFLSNVRRHIKLSESDSLFLLIDNQMVNVSENVETIYETHKGSDGYLVISASLENTFG